VREQFAQTSEPNSFVFDEPVNSVNHHGRNIMLKNTFSRLQRCHWQYGTIFIRLAVVNCLPNLRNPAKFSENMKI